MYLNSSACRVCLIDGDDHVQLFDNIISKYLVLLKEYTGFDFMKDEHLPSAICASCSSELIVVTNFMEKCYSSYEKLRNLQIDHLSMKEDIKEENALPIDVTSDVKIKLEKPDEDYHEYDGVHSSSVSQFHVKKVKNRNIKVKCKRKQELKLTCDTCGMKAPNKSALLTHLRKHTGEKPYVCSICHNCFSQNSTLKEHVGRVHDRSKLTKKLLVCDYCGKICYRRNELVSHIRVHTNEKPYECEICHMRFKQQCSLAPHLRRHRGEKPFSCHICGISFSYSSALNSHMRVHSDIKKYQCHVCNKLVKTKATLKTHLLLHAGEKPHVCDKCGATFSQKGNLKQHILKVHSERSGNCEKCRKFYSDLISHKAIHNGDRPFKCPECGTGFTKKSRLTLHLKRHKEKSKFKCTFNKCDVAFPMQCQLDYHIMKYHTKEYAYTCSGCTKGFYRLADLNRHLNLNLPCKNAFDNVETNEK